MRRAGGWAVVHLLIGWRKVGLVIGFAVIPYGLLYQMIEGAMVHTGHHLAAREIAKGDRQPLWHLQLQIVNI